MINIKDKSLKLFLSTVLNKSIENINIEDLKKIEVINLNSIYIDGTENKIDFGQLLAFPNLKQINIENTFLSSEDVKIIGNINCNKLYFKKCVFEDNEEFDFLSLKENLEFYNCYIDSYDNLFSKLKNIKYLSISYPIDENVVNINKIPSSISVLILNGCLINHLESLSNLEECHTLSLIDTCLNDFDLGIFTKLKKLQELYLPEQYRTYDILDEVKKHVNIHFNLYSAVIEKEDNLNLNTKK